MIRDILSGGGNRLRTVLTAGLTVLVVAACGDSTGPETAKVQIQITDLPTDMLSKAEVWISHVYLQGGGDEEAENQDPENEETAGGRTDLYNDPENPQHFDLLMLQDQIADLTPEIDVPARNYGQLRFVIDSAKVTLAEGLTFSDGESTTDVLFVPSGMQSGVKVLLNGAIDADANEIITLLADFDVNENFTVVQGQQEGIIQRVTFHPVIRELNRDEEPES